MSKDSKVREHDKVKRLKVFAYWNIESLSSHWLKLCHIRSDHKILTASVWFSGLDHFWDLSPSCLTHWKGPSATYNCPNHVWACTEFRYWALEHLAAFVYSSQVSSPYLPSHPEQLSVWWWSLFAISPGLPRSQHIIKLNCSYYNTNKHLNLKKRLSCSAGLGFSSSLS